MRNVSDKIYREKTQILSSVNFFLKKSCPLKDNMAKYCGVWQATNDKMAHVQCMLHTKGYKHTLRYSAAFLLQQWLHAHLHYTYIACLVNSLFISGSHVAEIFTLDWQLGLSIHNI